MLRRPSRLMPIAGSTAWRRITPVSNQDQGSTRGEIKRAGWDDAFLLNLLARA